MPVTRYRTGVILVLAAGLLWSVMGLALRHIHTADTWQILFYRSLGMVPVLLAFIAWRSGGSPWPRLRRAGWAGVIGGLGLVLAFAGAIYAIQTTTVANAVFLFAASPFFTAVLSRLVLGETVRRTTWMSIAIAAVGMLIMVREGLAAGELAGNLAALASAMGFAGFTLALRWSTLEETTPAVALGGIFAVLVAAAVCLFRGTGLVVPLPDAGIAFGMGAMVLAGGMICYTLGSRVIPAAELTLLSMIEVLMAPVWVFVFLNETANPGTFVGGLIVMAAIAINALTGIRRKPAAVPTV